MSSEDEEISVSMPNTPLLVAVSSSKEDNRPESTVVLNGDHDDSDDGSTSGRGTSTVCEGDIIVTLTVTICRLTMAGGVCLGLSA